MGNQGYKGDKAKGIIAKPMPKHWYDRHAVRNLETDPEDIDFNMSIIADKKPYFMRYIYPTLMGQYNDFIKNTRKKSLREFRKTVDELLNTSLENLSNEEQEFLKYYHIKMPVSTNNCVMNRICRRFEEEFDGYITKHANQEEFDYRIMKSGEEYSVFQLECIDKIHQKYIKRVQEYMQYSKKERIDDDEIANHRNIMLSEFKIECQEICSNERQLCDILLDLCYKKEGSKQFVWDISSEAIISSLLRKNRGYIAYPVPDPSGDITFAGEKYSFSIKQLLMED